MATLRTNKLAKGVSYTVEWRLSGTRDGSRERESFRDKSVAAQFKLDVEVAGHQWPDGWVKGVGYPTAESETEVPTFLAFATDVIESRSGIQPDTRAQYHQQAVAINESLAMLLGRAAHIADLDELLVGRWVNRAEDEEGRAPKTIANYHGLLFAVCEKARRMEWLKTNPCESTRLPRQDDDLDGDDEEKVFLTPAEFKTLFEFMRQDYRDFITVDVGTGLRWGEITALQVRDLDLDAPTPRLSVRRAWKRAGKDGKMPHGAIRHSSLNFYLGKPKSRKSRRRITLSRPVVAALRRAIVDKESNDFVFTAPEGGNMNHSHFYDRRWTPAVTRFVAKTGRPAPRFHDLRHTHAAWLISEGIPLPVIQKRLGHDSIQTTVDTYGGLMDETHEAADAAIEAMLTGGKVIRLVVERAKDPAADYEVTYDPDDSIADEDIA